MSSREIILDKIRVGKPKPYPLPVIPEFQIPGNEIANFVCHVKGFDGDYQLFSTKEEALEWLKKAVDATDKKVFSATSDVAGNVSLSDFTKPADMHTIDICVAEALMGIGETGSLFVDNKTLGDPAAALFSTDLYLLIDSQKIIAGIQDAYCVAKLKDYQYSSFFTGPSATADIEAVHISGAQGYVTLTAVVYNVGADDLKKVEEVMTRLPNGTPLGQPDAKPEKLVRYTDLDKGQDSV